MNVANLQKTDRWLGSGLCFFLTLLRKVIEPRKVKSIGKTSDPDAKPADSPRRLLFVKLAEQGSTVLAYPAIRKAVEMVGQENVYFIVFAENRFILDVLGLIPEQNVLTLSPKSFASLAVSFLRAIRSLRALKLDAAIDLEFFARGSAAITFLSGAKRRVGFHSFFGEGPYRGDLMTHRLLYNPYLHTAQMFQIMVEALNVDPAKLPTLNLLPPPLEAQPPMFLPRPEELAEVKNLLGAEIGCGDCPPLVLLNPNASDLLPLRKWASDRYVELAIRLLRLHPEIYIAMTGAPNERLVIEQLVREVGSARCVSLAGKTTLRRLLVLYHLAEVLVTNDSGPAHFASLTPIQVITLFGPETPALYATRTPRSIALWSGIVCSPCVNAQNNRQSPCQNNVCMQQITVDQVFAEAERILNHRMTKRH